MEFSIALSSRFNLSKASEIGEYFRGKGAFYWKVDKILSVAAPVFGLISLTAFAVAAGVAIPLSLMKAAGAILIGKICGIALAILGPLALITVVPLANHLGFNRKNCGGDLFFLFKGMRQIIDPFSLEKLTRWQSVMEGGAASWMRDCDWASIFDFYYHARSARQLIYRIHDENVKIPLEEIGAICRTKAIQDEKIRTELRAQARTQLKQTSIKEVIQFVQSSDFCYCDKLFDKLEFRYLSRMNELQKECKESGEEETQKTIGKIYAGFIELIQFF